MKQLELQPREQQTSDRQPREERGGSTRDAGGQRLRPEIHRIISHGRVNDQATGSLKAVAAVSSLTGVLLWFSFTPLDFSPLAWVALVPFCQLLRVRHLPRKSYVAVTAISFVCWVVTLQWMRLGHWTMHFALLALSFYISLYAPVFLAAGRRMVNRGVPLWLAVPVLWTALELLRAYLMTGFAWYYLGHSQYRWTSLIQVSDVTGAYGVSFVVALSSATLASMVPVSWLIRLGLIREAADVLPGEVRAGRAPAVVTVAIVAAVCLYGQFRRQPDSPTSDGPVVAIVQGNFTPEVKHDRDQWLQMVRVHDLLMTEAAKLRPDVIVWPETMFPVPDFVVDRDVSDADLIAMLPPESGVSNAAIAKLEVQRWRDEETRTLLENRSQETAAAVVFGMQTHQATKDGMKTYNSAAFVRPDIGYVGRYDKMHRVVFGEYIPLRSVFPWLAKLTPFGTGFGIDAGQQPEIFEYGQARFAPVICFEDTVPHLIRRVVRAGDKSFGRPHVLVNLTNDGWFHGSSELDQHLITSTFRCVETRRPMVRAVNTGISAFIDSNGVIRQPQHMLVMDDDTAALDADFTKVDSMYDETTGKRRRQCSAVLCGQIPLDSRDTLYLRWGDWFPALCSVTALLALVYPVRRRD